MGSCFSSSSSDSKKKQGSCFSSSSSDSKKKQGSCFSSSSSDSKKKQGSCFSSSSSDSKKKQGSCFSSSSSDSKKKQELPRESEGQSHTEQQPQVQNEPENDSKLQAVEVDNISEKVETLQGQNLQSQLSLSSEPRVQEEVQDEEQVQDEEDVKNEAHVQDEEDDKISEEVQGQSRHSQSSFSSEGSIRMGIELPRFVVLKSNYNHKYLLYVKEDVKVHGYLKFCGEQAVSPYAKYEVEMAKSEKGLVHIRCCYNNKYWVRSSENDLWLVAGADELEENRLNWSCTLFEPLYINDNMVQFRHVQLGSYACLWRRGDIHDSCLFAGSKSINEYQSDDVCTFLDWESLIILPKYVAFKSDNGKYLSAQLIDGYPYLHFGSSDKGDPTVGNKVHTIGDGSVRIKSTHTNKFWRLGDHNWIIPDSEDTSNNNLHTLFWPVKVDKNIVALRNLGNNYFCKSLTSKEGVKIKNCLNASVSTISNEARLGVEELVLSRSIYNVNYRPMDARIYSQSVLTMANGHAINKTQSPNDVEVKLSYSERKSNTWNASVSLKLGVKTNIKAGVPGIAEGKIEIASEFTGEYCWGKTEECTKTMETVYRVSVPPMSTVKVSLLATIGSCDVPFSYSQRDTLINGKHITQTMDDGVYTGVNCFNFKYDTKQENL